MKMINSKKLIIPAIILGGTLLLLAMYFPGLRPERPVERVVEGTAAIGGSFTLVDQKNNLVTSESLKGKFTLVYFGFTETRSLRFNMCACSWLYAAGLAASLPAVNLLWQVPLRGFEPRSKP